MTKIPALSRLANVLFTDSSSSHEFGSSNFYFGAGAPPGPVISVLGSLYPVSPLGMNCVLPSGVLTTLLFSSHDHMLMRRFGVFTRTYRFTTCHGSTSDNGS